MLAILVEGLNILGFRLDFRKFLRVILATWLCLAANSFSSIRAAGVTWSSYFTAGEKALSARKPAEAEKNFRKAAELARKQSRNPDDLDRCLIKRARALELLDRTGEARTILKNVLARISSKYGPESRNAVPVMVDLGSIEESAGDHDQAMAYYSKALKIIEKNYGPYSPLAARVLHGMGRVSIKNGNRQDAESHLKRAITILSKDPNLDAAAQLKGLMHDYDNLIKGDSKSDEDLIRDFDKDILDQKGKPAGRKPAGNSAQIGTEPADTLRGPLGQSRLQQASRFALEASRREETDENELVAARSFQSPRGEALKAASRVVNDTVFNQERYEKGEAQYKRKVAVDIDSLGPYHPSVANDLSALAQLYISQKKFKKALPLLSRALSIYTDAYGSANLLTINTQAALASVEFQLGDLDESARHYRAALSQAQLTLGPDSLETAKILNGLAYLNYHQGKLEKARTLYEWAIASTEGAVGKKDPLVAACLTDYARLLHSLGRNKEASEAETRALRILAESKVNNR